MVFKKSVISEKDQIFTILSDCGAHMRANGIMQWDETYPTMQLVEKDILSENMTSVYSGDQLIGVMVMDEDQSSQYASVNWKYQENPILVVHRLAISPKLQGQGFGLKCMRYAETYAADAGYRSIRLDAYKGNEGLQQFYHNLGYQEVGEIPLEYTAGPFVCFEKAIP